MPRGEIGGDDVAVVLLIELEPATGHGATEVDLQLGDVLIGLDRAVKTSEHRVVTRREAWVRPWGGADERQGAHAIGILQGSGLGDHSAHRHADKVGGVDADRVEHPHRIAGHVLDPVRRAGPVDMGRQSDVPVVELHDPVPGTNQTLDQLGWPQTPPDASTVALRHPVQVPDTADGLRRPSRPMGAAATETDCRVGGAFSGLTAGGYAGIVAN
jgi:hypothetical protein